MADLDENSPIDRFADIAKRLGMVNGNSTVHVNINAGGYGVVVCVCACVVMLVIALFQARDLGDARAQVREHAHQLNAIYRVAPSIEREVRSRLEEDARMRAASE